MQALSLLNEPHLDKNVCDVLPRGRVVEVLRYDREPWSRGYKVTLESLDKRKSRTYFFLRVIEGEYHQEAATSEYQCQHDLGQYIPMTVYSPRGYGTFQSDPNKSFFLTTFRDLQYYPWPKPYEVVDLLCTLHRIAVSPMESGFGFHLDTFHAKKPQCNQWCHDWNEFFSRVLRLDIGRLLQARANDQHFLDLVEFLPLAIDLVEKVVPRLLIPLQSKGRTIKPIMVIGDLQMGDLRRDRTTGRLGLAYLGACYYAHHEMGLVKMLNAWAPGDDAERDQLLQLYEWKVGFSEPVCEYNDRLLLYALQTKMRSLTEDASQKGWFLQGMRYLVEKYPRAYDERFDDPRMREQLYRDHDRNEPNYAVDEAHFPPPH